MIRDDFEIVNDPTASAQASHHIRIKQGDKVLYVGQNGKTLRLVESRKNALHFKSDAAANKRLLQALEGGDFAKDPPA